MIFHLFSNVKTFLKIILWMKVNFVPWDILISFLCFSATLQYSILANVHVSVCESDTHV